MIAIQYQLRDKVRNKVWENFVLRVDDSLRHYAEEQLIDQIWNPVGTETWTKTYNKMQHFRASNIS